MALIGFLMGTAGLSFYLTFGFFRTMSFGASFLFVTYPLLVIIAGASAIVRFLLEASACAKILISGALCSSEHAPLR
jgi:hypothetical protein